MATSQTECLAKVFAREAASDFSDDLSECFAKVLAPQASPAMAAADPFEGLAKVLVSNSDSGSDALIAFPDPVLLAEDLAKVMASQAATTATADLTKLFFKLLDSYAPAADLAEFHPKVITPQVSAFAAADDLAECLAKVIASQAINSGDSAAPHVSREAGTYEALRQS